MTEQEIEELALVLYPPDGITQYSTACLLTETLIERLDAAGFDIVRRPERTIDPDTPKRSG